MARTAALLLLFLPAASACVLPGPGIEGQVAGFAASAGGTSTTVTPVPPPPSTGIMDVETTGLGGTEVAPYVVVRADVSFLYLALSGFNFSTSGTGFFAGSFRGVPFTGPVNSSLDLRNAKAQVGITVLDAVGVRLAPFLGVDYFDVDMLMRDVATPASSGVDEQLPVPVVGLRADWNILDIVRVGGEFNWISLNVIDFDVALVDAEVAAYVEPFSHVEIMLGYRVIDLQFDGTSGGDRIDAAVDLSGPFLGVGVIF